MQILLDQFPSSTLALNPLLEAYGRDLWAAGRPYYLYRDLVSGVGASRRDFRPALARAWDLGFQWMAAEPMSPTLPTTRPLMLAMFSLAILKG